MSTTIQLPPAPLYTFAPFKGCDDETAVYLHAVVHTLDAERSEMWMCHQRRADILTDVREHVAAPYARPVVVALCDGFAVGILGGAVGLRVEDANGRELVTT